MAAEVWIIEYERGWGSKVDEVKSFDTEEEAAAFVQQYNAEFNSPKPFVPDWYMIAELKRK